MLSLSSSSYNHTAVGAKLIDASAAAAAAATQYRDKNQKAFPQVDSYSGFFDNNKKCHTELDAILKSHKIERIILAGLAFDYCVGFTALDAVELGYEVALVEDATRPVAEESAKEMRSKLQKAGVKLVMAAEVRRLEGTVASVAYVR